MIGAQDSALQHEHAPRPLPLFLELVRDVAAREPAVARDALRGLALYSDAERQPPRTAPEKVAVAGAASLRAYAGAGMPVILVPSLINPPRVLDLDEDVSLARAFSAMGFQPLMLDWGPAVERGGLSVGGHVEELMVPLLRSIGEPGALVGYCLGGTMSLAAAALTPVAAVATLACPWRFSLYPESGRAALKRLWEDALPLAEALGVLPIEVLQASFWSLDPERTVRKFAELNALEPSSPNFRRFVALEDWANEGDPLPLPAAHELLVDFFGADLPGKGAWRVAGRIVEAEPPCPTIHFTAARDRITPEEAAPPGERIRIPAGHVGMVVGRARTSLHRQLESFLASCR